MKRRQTTLLLAAALILAACAKNDEPAPADQARMMDLMRAIYGAAEGDHVIATLRNGENPLRLESYRLKPVSMRGNIKGKWHFEPTEKQAYDDLVVDYSGNVETRPGNAPDSAPRSRSVVKSTLRYTYRRGEYVLVSGELPSVPGL